MDGNIPIIQHSKFNISKLENTSSSIVDMATMRLTPRHYRIVAVASLGQLIGTALATMVSVMIPMLQIVTHPELPSWQQGLLGAIDLIGIAIGSVILGKLADKYGYLLFFRICPTIMLIAALLAILFPTVPVLFISPVSYTHHLAHET